MPPSVDAPGSPPPAPGEELSIALALVNTRLDGPNGPRDLLATPSDAHAWLVRKGFTVGDISLDAGRAAALVRLRESVRTLILARLADLGGGASAEAAEAIEVLNAALAAAPCVTSLRWDGEGPRVAQQRRGRDPFAEMLAAFAADGADLLAGPHAERLARCEAHNCIRLYIRTHAARQVCSTRCGDRIRAARHYARKRGS